MNISWFRPTIDVWIHSDSFVINCGRTVQAGRIKVRMMNFVLKRMHFVLKRMHFVLNKWWILYWKWELFWFKVEVEAAPSPTCVYLKCSFVVLFSCCLFCCSMLLFCWKWWNCRIKRNPRTSMVVPNRLRSAPFFCIKNDEYCIKNYGICMK